MATDKKKAKRVATLFGKQKVTTTPEIAAKIKSGEIDPGTHSIKNGKFAPKRKAVVGGLGIVPSAGKLKGSINNLGDSKVPTTNKAGFKATASAGDDSYDPATGYSNSKKPKNTAVNAFLPKGTVPTIEQVPLAKGAPTMVEAKTDKTGQQISPAQNQELQEQKAIQIAPYKADIATLGEQLNALVGELDADDDEMRGTAVKKLEKIKAAISAAKE